MCGCLAWLWTQRRGGQQRSGLDRSPHAAVKAVTLDHVQLQEIESLAQNWQHAEKDIECLRQFCWRSLEQKISMIQLVKHFECAISTVITEQTTAQQFRYWRARRCVVTFGYNTLLNRQRLLEGEKEGAAEMENTLKTKIILTQMIEFLSVLIPVSRAYEQLHTHWIDGEPYFAAKVNEGMQQMIKERANLESRLMQLKTEEPCVSMADFLSDNERGLIGLCRENALNGVQYPMNMNR